MKNLSTNESTYFESALGTPTKLPQNFEAQKPKQIFLIDSGLESQPGEMEYPLPLPPLPDLQPKKKIEPKIEKNKNILKKVKNKALIDINKEPDIYIKYKPNFGVRESKNCKIKI